MSIGLAVQYLILIAILAYQIVVKNPGTTYELVTLGITIILVVFYFYNRKKYYQQLDNTRLIIDNDLITKSVPKQADRSIYLNNIKEIKDHKQGFVIVDKDSSKRSIFISRGFENFDGIEKLIRDHIANNL